MERYEEARQWYTIINHYPDWTRNYDELSVSVEFDQMNDEYQRLLAGRVVLRNAEREWKILQELSDYRDCIGTIRDEEQLIIHGHGIYVSTATGDVGFLSEVTGISGDFNGYTLNTIPPLNDFLYQGHQHELVNRSLLSIELGRYVLHGLNGETYGGADDTLIIPIHKQDIVALRYQERYVG